MEEELEENFETMDSTSTLTSNRLNKSRVWDEFEKFICQNGKEKARCIHCSKEYLSESRYGTSNMKRHLNNCRKRPREAMEAVAHDKKVDQTVYKEKLAEAVLLHGYAFMWAEHKGDRAIHSFLNNSIKPICRNTMKAECLKLHKKHMERVKSIFKSIPGRVCLTTDLWTSWNTEGYLCLTAHYIDNDWKLCSKILNFRHVPPPHSAMVLCEIIHDMLKEWGIDRKVFSITMDNALNMDNMQERLRYRLSAAHNSLICGGNFFHIRCCAHILNLIVQAGMKVIARSVEKVRESVKYVKASEARRLKFRDC
jgi:BED zinc finger